MNRMKGVAEEGINSTPYVDVQWVDGTKSRALFDTGAQWTIITEELLSERELHSLEESSLSGQGVTGEKIPVIGEAWRTVKLGGLTFENQRFVVVKKMICPIILGIDFWSRVSQISFDFNKKSMRLNGGVKR